MSNTNEEQWKFMVMLLKQIAIEKGITQMMIAERSGLKQSNISRMFALKYKPTLDTFLGVVRALNLNLFFEDKDSDSELNQAFERAMEKLGRRFTDQSFN